jgi:hypothetical protein
MVRLAGRVTPATNATLAQLVEHLIRNEKVAGSIPAGGSTNRQGYNENKAGSPAEALA